MEIRIPLPQDKAIVMDPRDLKGVVGAAVQNRDIPIMLATGFPHKTTAAPSIAMKTLWTVLILSLLALVVAVALVAQTAFAHAQTILPGDTKVAIIFYVKEGTASPYQGRLEFTQQEYAKLSPAAIAKAQLAQHAAWKVATEAARSVVIKEPTKEEKAAEIDALRDEAQVILRKIADESAKADIPLPTILVPTEFAAGAKR